jgi:nicotinamide mononucleotide adenylyltransferase
MLAEDRDQARANSRSRSLRSGYNFGPAHGPDVDTRTESSSSTPPSVPGQDSPPLLASRASFHTLLQEEEDDNASNPTGIGAAGAESSKMKHRAHFDGLDALSGLNDGEADLDATAIQAEGHGTEGYLTGVDGDAGAYHFPRHRLRTTMKGRSRSQARERADRTIDESKIPLVIGV